MDVESWAGGAGARVGDIAGPRAVVIRGDSRLIRKTMHPRIGRITMGGHTSGHRTCVRGRGRRVRRPCRLRGVIGKPSQQDIEKELARGQAFDHAHRPAAAGARPRAPGARDGGAFGQGWRGMTRQGLTTLRQRVRPTPRREDPEVADADKALREDVEEKTPEKFLRLDGEGAHLAAVPIVLPPK